MNDRIRYHITATLRDILKVSQGHPAFQPNFCFRTSPAGWIAGWSQLLAYTKMKYVRWGATEQDLHDRFNANIDGRVGMFVFSTWTVLADRDLFVVVRPLSPTELLLLPADTYSTGH